MQNIRASLVPLESMETKFMRPFHDTATELHGMVYEYTLAEDGQTPVEVHFCAELPMTLIKSKFIDGMLVGYFGPDLYRWWWEPAKPGWFEIAYVHVVLNA